MFIPMAYDVSNSDFEKERPGNVMKRGIRAHQGREPGEMKLR